MTQKTIDDMIDRLEREMSGTDAARRAEAAARLRTMLKSEKPTKSDVFEYEDEDLFDNMPI